MENIIYINSNPLSNKLFKVIENSKNEFIEQKYEDVLLTIICILYPFSKGNKSHLDSQFFKSYSEVDTNVLNYIAKNILIIGKGNSYYSKLFNLKKEKEKGDENIIISDFCKN